LPNTEDTHPQQVIYKKIQEFSINAFHSTKPLQNNNTPGFVLLNNNTEHLKTEHTYMYPVQQHSGHKIKRWIILLLHLSTTLFEDSPEYKCLRRM
jgi:hypothetical protein